jgi:hypothetical protein
VEWEVADLTKRIELLRRPSPRALECPDGVEAQLNRLEATTIENIPVAMLYHDFGLMRTKQEILRDVFIDLLEFSKWSFWSAVAPGDGKWKGCITNEERENNDYVREFYCWRVGTRDKKDYIEQGKFFVFHRRRLDELR